MSEGGIQTYHAALAQSMCLKITKDTKFEKYLSEVQKDRILLTDDVRAKLKCERRFAWGDRVRIKRTHGHNDSLVVQDAAVASISSKNPDGTVKISWVAHRVQAYNPQTSSLRWSDIHCVELMTSFAVAREHRQQVPSLADGLPYLYLPGDFVGFVTANGNLRQNAAVLDMVRVPSFPVDNYYYIRYVYADDSFIEQVSPDSQHHRRWVPERKLIFVYRNAAPIEVRIEGGKRIIVYDDPLGQTKDRVVKFTFAPDA